MGAQHHRSAMRVRGWRFRSAVVATLLAGIVLVTGCTAPLPSDAITALHAVEVSSPFGVVSTGYPEATHAGVAMLEAGGNAVDAAVTAAFVAGAASPGSSGLGGTTYILIRMADGRAVAIDGSGRVPMFVNRQALLKTSPDEEVFGIKVAAVPGTPAALDRALAAYGTRSLAEVLEPAIEVAEHGFEITDWKRTAIAKYLDSIRQTDLLRLMLFPDGWNLPPVGTRICQQDLARTLRRLGERGIDDFYRGEIAEEIAADMERRGGNVRAADLALYRALEREPVRGSYRGREVLAFPWPSSGAAVVEALNILEEFPSASLRSSSADRLQVMGEAFHMALEDHYRFTISASLLDRAPDLGYTGKPFAAERAALIHLDRPVSEEDFPPVHPAYVAQGGTTQVSVADRWGNVVSLTQTVGRFYGGKAIAGDVGFIHNSFLEGFDAADPTALRPRTSCPTDMAPTIVLEDGRLLVALGSAASERIPGVVAFTISAMVDGGLDVRDAVLAPRVLWNTNHDPTSLIVEVWRPVTGDQVAALERRGYRDALGLVLPAVRRDFIKFGAVNAVSFDPVSCEYQGVADPRREGFAAAAGY